MSLIRGPKDFYAGLLFIAFGAATIAISFNYALGSAARMGPGYFPRVLGIILVVLGAVLMLRAMRAQGAAVPRFQFRPLLIVLGSVVGFALVVEKIGLFVGTVLLIFCASAASREFRWREALASGIFFALLAIGVFVVGLKLQLPVWPPLLVGPR